MDAEPPKTVRGVKLLFTVTLRLATVNIAVAGNWGFTVVPDKLAVTFAIGIVLVRVPAAPVAFKSTLIAQVPVIMPTWAGTIPPVSVMELDPAIAVKTPPQLVEAFGTAATTRLAGKESVRFRLVNALRYGLVSVIVVVDEPFGLTVMG